MGLGLWSTGFWLWCWGLGDGIDGSEGEVLGVD